MGKYRRYKNFLEKFLDSNAGKRFFNIAYSIGASIVIIGAMAKILHWSFGNEMLMIGMITEALVFFISAFEKPAKDYKWEEVYPVLADDNNFIPKSERVVQTEQARATSSNPAIQSTSTPNQTTRETASSPSVERQTSNINTNNTANSSGSGSGTVILGGGSVGASGGTNLNAGTTSTGGSPVSGNITIVSGGGSGSSFSDLSEDGVEYLSKMADNMDKFAKATDALMKISDSLQQSFSTITENADGIGDNTQNYITQMETLNRNVAGLNTIYEIQLKGVSGQINTIEHINAGLERMKKLYDGSLVDSSIFQNETEKMAKQLSELNMVYARLLQAMTSNMNMGGGFGATNMGNSNPNPQQP